MWWKKNRWKAVTVVGLVLVLAAVFWYGGNSPGARGWVPEEKTPVVPLVESDPADDTEDIAQTPDTKDVPVNPESGSPEKQPEGDQKPVEPETPDDKTSTQLPPDTEPPSVPAGAVDPETGKDQYQTEPVPDGKPNPVEPEETQVGTASYTCTLSISCATILDNLDLCDPEKVELVPEDGWILEPVSVTFHEGESVFNVLQRTCKQQGIHMEFQDTPIYNSAYIKGIQNLYEFDVGELSGWMYQVNDWFPNYGCSRYQLKDGDVVCWVYTCNLGDDVGGGYATGNT